MSEERYSVCPGNMFIIYTLGCNSRCITCDYWKNERVKADDEMIFEAVCEQYDKRLRSLFFTGGECLIYAESMFALCRKIKSRCPGIRLKINTNGILLSRYANQVCEVFDTVVVSLDSTDPKVYQTIRGVDMYSKVLEGIHAIREIRPEIRISIRSMLLEENLDGIDALVEMSIRDRIDRLSFIACDMEMDFAFGRNGASYHKTYSDAFIEKLRAVKDHVKQKYPVLMQTGNFLEEQGRDFERAIELYSMGEHDPDPCNCPTNSCVIYPNGSVSPCFQLHAVGDIHQNTLTEVFESDAYQETVRQVFHKKEINCRKCVCPVVFA